jgi:hypothetical protein
VSERIILTLTAAQAEYIGRRAAKLRLDVPETIRRIIDIDMLKKEGIIPEWLGHTSFNSWFHAQGGREDNVGVAARYCSLAGDLSGPKAFCVWVAKQAADKGPPPKNAVDGLKEAIREWDVTKLRARRRGEAARPFEGRRPQPAHEAPGDASSERRKHENGKNARGHAAVANVGYGSDAKHRPFIATGP